jgi:anti-sigma factor RsiW
MSDHISELRWDQLLAGELSAEARADAEAHAKTCDACQARFDEISKQREAYRFRLPKKRSLKWTMPIAGALAVAAAAMLVLKFTGQEPDESVVGESTKGGKVEVMLFSGQPDKLVEVSEQIFAGDVLQAGYTSPVDGYGAVLSLDGAGNANTYVPAVGNAMVLLPAGERRSFPASTQLDDVLGTERIAVIWCHRVLPLEPLVEELKRTSEISRREGCAIRVVAVAKAMR